MSPRSPQQFEAIRTESMQIITHAAMELFSQQGYQNVSVNQIAKQAGVSKGLIYNYFKSKEALLLHILENMMIEMNEIMQEIEAETTPLAKVKKIIHLTFQHLKNKKAFWSSVMPILTQQAVGHMAEEKLKAFFVSAIGILEKLFQEAGIPHAHLEAYKLGALLDGIALDYIFLFRESYPLQALEQLIMDQYQTLKPNP